jgi:hypothetical protein
MKVNDFIKKFTIEPIKDIEANFKLSKKLDIDASMHKGCFNCGDLINQRWLESAPWTSVQYCWKCQHLNVIYHSDRMGGNYTDTIECYTEN